MHKSSIGLARGRFSMALTIAPPFLPPPLICRISSISFLVPLPLPIPIPFPDPLAFRSPFAHSNWRSSDAKASGEWNVRAFPGLSPCIPSFPHPSPFFFLAAPLNTLLDSICGCQSVCCSCCSSYHLSLIIIRALSCPLRLPCCPGHWLTI